MKNLLGIIALHLLAELHLSLHHSADLQGKRNFTTSTGTADTFKIQIE